MKIYDISQEVFGCKVFGFRFLQNFPGRFFCDIPLTKNHKGHSHGAEGAPCRAVLSGGEDGAFVPSEGQV